MNILENLEALNVSEECFNEIMNMIENLVDRAYANWNEARKKYNEPEIREIGKKAYGNLTPEEKEKFEKVADEYHKKGTLLNKAYKMRDENEFNFGHHNRAGETKGERNQRSADFRNPRYSGEHGIYIKDRRTKQDAESGYNVAINKAIRRHEGKH